MDRDGGDRTGNSLQVADELSLLRLVEIQLPQRRTTTKAADPFFGTI